MSAPNFSSCTVQIQELRSRLKDVSETDPDFKEGFYLYYWLKAGKFNVDQAEDNIRENLKWREENDISHLRQMEYCPEIFKGFPFHRDGRSRNGMTVWRLNAGRFKFGEELHKHGKEKVLLYWLQVLSKAEKAFIENTRDLIKSGVDPSEICEWPLNKKNWCILNMEGMNYSELLSKKTVMFFVNLVRITVNYFPFLDGTACFVNAGKLMEMFFKLARPFFKGSNVDMIVFDSNKAKWKDVIFEHIDPLEIPALAKDCE
ncbi:unnamed protein product [Allacma fusca]|uniref:CRAL-TRIO domain-containing protein n=1 Tax=Allacma fusca TaxID=39272 RepID=A0A8J2PNF2_9HEXA|nr:unnamed protein product [Allacma fusca]